MADASGIFYNVTGIKCYDLPTDPDFDGIWDYQWCTEMLPQETYFGRDGVHDMFWAEPMDMAAINAHCNSTLGVVPRPDWIAEEFGGAAAATNIVFSNGLYDPWSSGGVVRNVSTVVVATDNGTRTRAGTARTRAADGITAVIIPEGAHHLDLMFSNAQDPPSVVAARQVELAHIRQWIAAANSKNRQN